MSRLLAFVLLAAVGAAQPAPDSLAVRTDTTIVDIADAPLLVVDGVVAGRGDLPFALDPQNIVSVEMMDRDDALAAYGDEARNGVVVITTRRNGAAPDSAHAPTGVRERTVRAVIRAQVDGGGWVVVEDTTDAVRTGHIETLVLPSSRRAPGLLPDSARDIRIRPGPARRTSSDRDPLYVLDGIRMPLDSQTNPLAQVEPRDIESIEVLKDEEATNAYGAAGMRGVVLITTNNRARQEAAEAARNADAFSISGVLVESGGEIADIVLALPEAGEARVELRDGTGRIVRWAKGLLGAGAGAIRLGVAGLGPGTYTIHASADVDGDRREATTALTIDP